MGVHATSQTTRESTGYEGYADEDRGYGWVVLAGVLLLIAGTLNTIEGIAAIGNAHFFVHNTHYVVGSLNTWGWIVLCIGVIELAVGLGVFAKNQPLTLDRHLHPLTQLDRATADDPGLPLLVTDDRHVGHPRHLRTHRLRPSDQRQLTKIINETRPARPGAAASPGPVTAKGEAMMQIVTAR